MFNAADRAHPDDAAPEKRGAVHLLIEMLDARGILAHDHRGKIFHCADHRAGLLLQAGFPQPYRPGWSVSTLTRTQFRKCAFTTIVLIFVTFISLLATPIWIRTLLTRR